MKNSLAHFKIPVQGLQAGIHSFQLQVENEFFTHFDNSIIDNGRFTVQLDFLKKEDHSELQFEVKGVTTQICDRCLGQVEIPMQGSYKMYLKMGLGTSDDEDIIYMAPTESHLSVASAVYEILTILLPLRKICPEVEGVACNDELLDTLYDQQLDQDEDDPKSDIWSSLDDLRLD